MLSLAGTRSHTGIPQQVMPHWFAAVANPTQVSDSTQMAGEVPDQALQLVVVPAENDHTTVARKGYQHMDCCTPTWLTVQGPFVKAM
jgi:hypothetical protein